MNALIPLYFFITVTSIYIILRIYLIKTGTDETTIGNSNNIYTYIYIFVILIGNFSINKKISQEYTSEIEVSNLNILFVTLIPWVFIFGSLFILLSVFTSWVKPFSNTIGYLFVQLLGINSIYDTIFKTDVNAEQEIKMKELLITLKTNKIILINEMSSDIDNFKHFIFELINSKFTNIKLDKIQHETKLTDIKFSLDNKEQTLLDLYKIIIIKDEIGKFIWFILAGMLITTIVFNTIQSITS
tara:strand:+ start:6276 stop:7004 length:729 start_codon:yes stop_codon:yes gene_type:complete